MARKQKNNSRKSASKSAKKAPDKKVRKRRKITLRPASRPVGIIDHDDVLRKINFVQVQRKEAHFRVAFDEALVVDNILRDAGLVFQRTDRGKVSSYNVAPGAPVEEGEHALDALEELDDEVLEDGQIFN